MCGKLVAMNHHQLIPSQKSTGGVPLPSTLLYPVSLLSGCWSLQKPKYQYRDNPVGQLTNVSPEYVFLAALAILINRVAENLAVHEPDAPELDKFETDWAWKDTFKKLQRKD